MIPALLLGLAQAAPAPPLAEPYEALGHDPAWTLRIEGGQARFTRAGRGPVSAALPAARTGTVQGVQGPIAVSGFDTPGLRLVIMHALCIDYTGGRQYADAVTVTLGGTEYQGCGGSIVPFDILHETAWRIVEIAGEAVPPASDGERNPGISFSFGGYLLFAGCTSYSGRYRLQGDEFVIPSWAPPLRTDCAEAARNRQQRLVAMLGAPARISIEGDTLTLTGAAGTLRMTREREEQ